MEILRAEHLYKKYGNGESSINALNDVSFSVQSGELVSIVGSSGSGKSTLIHIIGTVDRPTSGTVYVNGQNVFEQSNERLAIFRRRQVGIIYQFDNLLPLMSVEENILLPALLDGRNINRDYFNELIDMLGLKGKEHSLASRLSGGQQQRVAIGRTMINTPAIVLADEPTGNLDSRNTQEIMNLFLLFNKRYQQTLIMITHDESLALQTNRILTLEDGKILSDERIK